MHWVLYASITESYYETLLFVLHRQMQHDDCQLLVWYYSELFFVILLLFLLELLTTLYSKNCTLLWSEFQEPQVMWLSDQTS